MKHLFAFLPRISVWLTTAPGAAAPLRPCQILFLNGRVIELRTPLSSSRNPG
ncbi:MAG: hypothetical protein OJI67_06540 [Prosthecobacter sp.]|nr:hypothetical protein [Prosthecobacter sp.]